MNKCKGSLFLGVYQDMGASTSVCLRGEKDLLEAIKATSAPDPCKRHITKKQVEKLQEQKKGEWFMVNEYCNHAKEFRCSVCGVSIFYDHYTRRCDYDFCPSCGANMEDEYA